MGLGGGDAELEVEFSSSPNPTYGDVARAVADVGDDFAGDGATQFLVGKNVGEDLAGMLGIGQRVDGRDSRPLGEILDVALRVGADDRAVYHSSEHAGGVLDGFASAELKVVGVEEHHVAAQFTDAYLEGDAGACGGFGENHRPRLARERLVLAVAALGFHHAGVFQNGLDGRGVHRFDTQEMFHCASSLMTLSMMASFGVQAQHTDYQRFTVPGNQRYQSPGHFLVEGDASTASYFLAAAAIRGDVTVHGVGRRSLQGDVAFAEVVRAMGAKVDCQDDFIRVQSTGKLRGVDVDLNHIPDAAMTVAILALFADGPTSIRNIYNWRIKETDRMTAMATELQRVGAGVTTTSDSITITPPATLLPASIETYGDHRMAMCFSLVALGRTPVLIKNPEVTSKTAPDYFKIFESVCER